MGIWIEIYEDSKARKKFKIINIKVDAISAIKLENKSLAALLKKKLGYCLIAP